MTGRPVKSPPSSAEDAVLVAYFERRDALLRFFAARTRSEIEAEDLTQELYLKLAARSRDAEVERPLALLYRIATNLMLDRARRESRATARETAWRDSAHTSFAGQDIADEPPADEAAAARQRLRELIAAAQTLPPQMGRAFRLHKLEGLSHAETARAMGLSVKAVEKHVSAALKSITRKLYP